MLMVSPLEAPLWWWWQASARGRRAAAVGMFVHDGCRGVATCRGGQPVSAARGFGGLVLLDKLAFDEDLDLVADYELAVQHHSVPTPKSVRLMWPRAP
jgi:hypothetical protein